MLLPKILPQANALLQKVNVAYNTCTFRDRESRILLFQLPKVTATQVTVDKKHFIYFAIILFKYVTHLRYTE